MLVKPFRAQSMNVLIGIFIGSAVLLVMYFSIRNQYSEETNAFSRFTSNKTRSSRQVFFQHEHEGTDVAKVIRENVRVFCWIMTDEQNTKTRAIHVNATWAKRCNKYVFITPAANSDLPSVDLHVTEGYNFLWGKTKAAFKYIYDNELNNYDWFLKADDDTYVIMENLRFMLLAYSPDDPVYFGVRFKLFVRQGYMSSGGGYVLSREAVKRLVEDGLPDTRKCRDGEYGKEDVEIGKCLEKVGVIAGDSRDRNGKFRFLPFSPLTHLQEGGSPPNWFFAYSYYPYKQGEECCSDYAISFHYVDEATIHTIHDFIYHVRAFGVSDGFHIKAFASSKNLSLIEAARMHAKNVSQPLNLETTQ